ncbi:MAG: hypothetical protein ACYTAN_13390 [Planctomycetota bacterium]|jgi:hypothetical protein
MKINGRETAEEAQKKLERRMFEAMLDSFQIEPPYPMFATQAQWRKAAKATLSLQQKAKLIGVSSFLHFFLPRLYPDAQSMAGLPTKGHVHDPRYPSCVLVDGQMPGHIGTHEHP